MNSLSINDVLNLAIFKCKQCKRRCQYPVMIADKSGNYCPTCLKQVPYMVSEENVEINKILEKFIVPCRFNERGCDAADKIADLAKHEIKCDFRDKTCPFYSLEQCNMNVISNIPDHFLIEHPGCVLNSDGDNIKLSFDTQNCTNLDVIRLLRIYNEYFLLHIKFDVDSKELMYGLYLCGDPDDMKIYNCSVEQQNNDIHTKSKEFNLLHESDFTIPIVKTKAVLFDLPTLQRCFDQIETNIRISAKNALTNVKNSDLLKLVKCPTCQTYMRDKIFQCASGHSVCKECMDELRACSECKATFSGTRNYILESLTTLMKFPCAYRGCNKYFSKKNIDKHQGGCTYRQYLCPFSETFHCRWEGSHKDIVQHLKAEHSNNSVQNDFCERKISTSRDYVEVYALMAFNSVFRFHHEKIANTFSFCCKYIGPNLLAKRYMFEIGLINQQNRDNRLIIKNSWSKLNENELWVEIHNQDVTHYTSPQNDVLVYYKVSKYHE